MAKAPYNDKMPPDEQVSAEEEIAHLIFNKETRSYQDVNLDEEECAELGREILYRVLRRFRPDLFEVVGPGPGPEPEECRDCGSSEEMNEMLLDVDGLAIRAWVCDECGHAHIPESESDSA